MRISRNFRNRQPDGLQTLGQKVAAILRKYGTDAHVYLPGIGTINGLTAGNYLESTGPTVASIDGLVGLVEDATVATINAKQTTTANKPFLRKGAVNKVLWSEDFTNAAWVKTGVSIVAGKLTEDTGNTEHRLRQTGIVKASGKPIIFYADVKPDGRFIQLSLENAGSGLNTIFDVLNNSYNDTVASAGWTRGVTSITSLGNGQYRISISGITDTNTTFNARISFANQALGGTNQIYVGDGISGAYIYRCQIETGSTASTYVATTTAAKSNQVGNYAWENNSTDSFALDSVPFQMSDDHCVIAAIRPDSVAAGSKVIHTIYGAGTQKIAQLSVETATLTATWTDDAGTAGTSPTGSAVTAGTAIVACARKVGNSKQLYKNDVLINASTTAAGATTVTTAAIGGIGATNNFIGLEYLLINIKGTVSDADKTILSKFAGSLAGVSI